jgi:hypothetical protein
LATAPRSDHRRVGKPQPSSAGHPGVLTIERRPDECAGAQCRAGRGIRRRRQ